MSETPEEEEFQVYIKILNNSTGIIFKAGSPHDDAGLECAGMVMRCGVIHSSELHFSAVCYYLMFVLHFSGREVVVTLVLAHSSFQPISLNVDG